MLTHKHEGQKSENVTNYGKPNLTYSS